MQYILTLIVISVFTSSYGQSFTYRSIKSKGQSFVDFAPAGWTILDSAYGDLNNDGISDAVVIIQHKDSVSLINSLQDTVLTQPRILLIFFKDHVDNNFSLREQSNSFILKHDNFAMDDPYQELAINNGVLEIKFHFFYSTGSWYITNAVYKFRYQREQFVLIGADNSSFHRATHDFEDYSYNFLTKRRTLTKGNDDKGTKNMNWKSLKTLPLKTLKTFTEPFTWQVEKNVYL